MRAINWREDTFTIGGTSFELTPVTGWFPPTVDRFAVVKTRRVIEHHQRLLADLNAQRIVELGVCVGGSTALFAALCDPEKLVAIELSPDRLPGLDAHLERYEGRVEAHHGVDQSDVTALRTITAQAFAGPLDVVFDDASHLADLTRASFEVLYPMLRPGGCYVIEDWRHPPLLPFAHELLTEFADGRYPSLRVERHSIVVGR